MKDWRLQGQERYLQGVSLLKKTYRKYRQGWDHDHCEFCHAKFSEHEGDFHEGYTTSDGHRWVCEKCFADFKDTFHWRSDSDYTVGKQMIQETIARVIEGESLPQETAHAVMGTIMDGAATPAQIAGLLVALRCKGETGDELTGFARAMRERVLRVPVTCGEVVDTCGTGGDRSHTFNISTAAALVAAGAGVRIAKHGNRAVSSQCGSADVLEALGVRIDLTAVQVGQCIDEVGIGFLFALQLHPAMKHAGPTRRELGCRTVFNLLGPLTNPAGASSQVLGVFSPRYTELLATVLANLGSRRAFVVSGLSGLDEISICEPTQVTEVRDGRLTTYELEPETFGLPRAALADIAGGDAAANAGTIRDILSGSPGPKSDIVVLNAAAAIVCGGKAADIGQGIEVARDTIASGAAGAVLDRLRNFTVSCGDDHRSPLRAERSSS